MKIKCDKQGLNVTSKKFNPFKFSIYGIDINTEKNEKNKESLDPFKIIGELASVKKQEDNCCNGIGNIKAMRSLLNK